jgi:hypothetical protein
VQRLAPIAKLPFTPFNAFGFSDFLPPCWWQGLLLPEFRWLKLFQDLLPELSHHEHLSHTAPP